ncbi:MULTISPECIES: hypothetical protein [unclassified Paenarthrobacter]|uniref:hypothetical protein n=1 Tax=unclassified Paenarthrobacter TaxID=2634190 RepID=UPI0021C73191|nr:MULTISPECIES: hypothetical protein [unclassified Paenarthrobacter]MDD7837030.1 hypothetical protein [Paenarthrobacter sp. AB444]UXM92471.1 hypothetical protein N5P29_03875 [Paenarthrobacter sp. JL.01a]
MFDVSSKESTLRVSTSNGEPVSLTVDPSGVRVEIDTNCGCSETPERRVGSYTDTDFGAR